MSDKEEKSILVRVVCDRATMECSLPADQAGWFARLAKLSGEEATSSLALSTFVRDQIDGRVTLQEAARITNSPDYAEDIKHKVVVIALGLLSRKPGLQVELEEALRTSGSVIEIDLRQGHSTVLMSGRGIDEVRGLLVDGAGHLLH